MLFFSTLTHRGAKSIAEHLSQIPNLEYLNLGDCLIKTKGAEYLAQSLKTSHKKLKVSIMP